MAEQLCHWCGRPMAACRVDVDETWPATAREAFARAGYTQAATCDKGQLHDVVKTGGWCFDRARRDRYWRGTPLTDAERRGVGASLEAVDAARGLL